MSRVMGRGRVWIVVLVVLCALSGCNKVVETTVINTPEPTPVPTPTATPEPRGGGHLDEIIMSVVSEDQAVEALSSDQIDLYAGYMNTPQVIDTLKQSDLNLATTSNLNYEITLNTVDTRKTAKRLNPFYSKKIREALNYLIDRDYICQELFLGNAIPKAQPLGINSADYGRYIQYIHQVNMKYGYSKEEAIRVIQSEMDELGAVINEEGKWSYKNREVTLKFVIRNEDVRLSIGNYVADELESIGFVVERKHLTYAESFPLWATSEPEDGKWHLYTNAWIVPGTERDSSSVFLEEYTDQGSKPYRPYKYYEAGKDFTEVCQKLSDGEYTTLEEREALFGQAITTCNEEATRIWIAEGRGVVPMQTSLTAVCDVANGVEVAPCVPFTLRYKEEGGILRWGAGALLEDPINAIGGSALNAEQQVLRFTQDYALMQDPFSGLSLPQHVEHAEVYLTHGQAVEQTLDWVDVKHVEEIRVPNDIWVDWDAETQTFTVADQDYLERLVDEADERLDLVKQKRRVEDWEIEEAEEVFYQAKTMAKQGYMTVKRKSVVTYPDSLYDLMWHDGTHLSPADFVMRIIMRFELSDKGSALYHEDDRVNSWREHFKGYKIISTNPLVIESYHDDVAIDAESNVEAVWPEYGRGQAPWHLVAASNLAVTEGKLEYFSNAVAGQAGVQWMDWLSGDSLDILKRQVENAKTQGFVPYQKVLGAYINADTASKAYENLLAFHEAHGHFVVGCGPYYVKQVDQENKQVTLMHYKHYTEPSDKWEHLENPMVLKVKLDGPKAVKKGEENKFNVYATYGDEGVVYPHDALRSLWVMLYDEHGMMVYSEKMEAPMADGVYPIIITDTMIDALGEHHGIIEVVAVPMAVSVPAWDSMKVDVE